MKNFSELSISASLKNNLSKHGFTAPTPVQALSLEPALAGSNLVATAQTGTGKTLAFVIPLIQRLESEPPAKGIKAVVLAPTRELAVQISATFTQMAADTGLRSATVVGGVAESPQLQAIRKGASVLIATPGRLCDFLGRGLVDLSHTRMVVLDEADRMLDMGFLPAIQRIFQLMPAQRQTLFFSATIERSVQHLIERHVPNAVRVELGPTTRTVEEVELNHYEVEGDSKLPLLQQMLRGEAGSFLVFARTRHGADRLARKLSPEFKTAAIHGDRSQRQRNQALQGFQNGFYRVLVATDIAARGIHVEGIAHVVNYDLPQAPEDFIHRVGRTARAGAHGTASTFSTRLERSEIARIEKSIGRRMERRAVPGLAEVAEIKPAASRFVFRSRSVARRRTV